MLTPKKSTLQHMPMKGSLVTQLKVAREKPNTLSELVKYAHAVASKGGRAYHELIADGARVLRLQLSCQEALQHGAPGCCAHAHVLGLLLRWQGT